MKKWIALLLVATLMLSLTGCELLEKVPFVSDLLQKAEKAPVENNAALPDIDINLPAQNDEPKDETPVEEAPPADAEEEEEPEPESETPIKIGMVKVDDKLRIRTAPNTSAPIDGHLRDGDLVKIFEIREYDDIEWGRIGENQWISLHYVDILSSETTENGGTISTNTQFPADAPHLELYWQAIHDFRILLQHRLKPDWSWDGTLPAMSHTFYTAIAAQNDAWEDMVSDLPTYDARSEGAFGYILYDISGDDVPELFFVRNDYSIVAVFTCYKNALHLLAAANVRSPLYISENGALYQWVSSGASETTCKVYRVSGGSLVRKFYFGTQTSSEYIGTSYIEGTETYNYFETDEYTFNLFCHQFPNDINWFWQSFPIYALSHVPSEYDGGGEKEPNTKYLPYTQKVKVADYPVYTGPGYHYNYLESIEKPGTFTIVAEVTDWEGFLWGKLKSGDGWINLSDIRS